MGGLSMIIECQTLEQANTTLTLIDAKYKETLVSQGYGFDENGAIIGKTEGTLNPLSSKTTSWDVVTMSPDQTFYFQSPRGVISDGDLDAILSSQQALEKEFPEAWISEDVNEFL